MVVIVICRVLGARVFWVASLHGRAHRRGCAPLGIAHQNNPSISYMSSRLNGQFGRTPIIIFLTARDLWIMGGPTQKKNKKIQPQIVVG